MICWGVLRTAPTTTMLSANGLGGSRAAARPAPSRSTAARATGKHMGRGRIEDRRSRIGGIPAPRSPILIPASGPRARKGAERQLVTFRGDIDLDLVAADKLTGQDLLPEGILDIALDGPFERPGAGGLGVAVLDQKIGCARRALGLVAAADLPVAHERRGDLRDVLRVERMEYDDVVE